MGSMIEEEGHSDRKWLWHWKKSLFLFFYPSLLRFNLIVHVISHTSFSFQSPTTHTHTPSFSARLWGCWGRPVAPYECLSTLWGATNIFLKWTQMRSLSFNPGEFRWVGDEGGGVNKKWDEDSLKRWREQKTGNKIREKNEAKSHRKEKNDLVDLRRSGMKLTGKWWVGRGGE